LFEQLGIITAYNTKLESQTYWFRPKDL